MSNMLIVLLVMVLILVGVSIIIGDDLRERTPTTLPAWGIIILLFLCCATFAFMAQEEIRRNTLINYDKYELVTEIQADTTYFVKKIKDENN